jgi:hypothetical protein
MLLIPLPDLQGPEELLNIGALLRAGMLHQKATDYVEGDLP